MGRWGGGLPRLAHRVVVVVVGGGGGGWLKVGAGDGAFGAEAGGGGGSLLAHQGWEEQALSVPEDRYPVENYAVMGCPGWHEVVLWVHPKDAGLESLAALQSWAHFSTVHRYCCGELLKVVKGSLFFGLCCSAAQQLLGSVPTQNSMAKAMQHTDLSSGFPSQGPTHCSPCLTNHFCRRHDPSTTLSSPGLSSSTLRSTEKPETHENRRKPGKPGLVVSRETTIEKKYNHQYPTMCQQTIEIDTVCGGSATLSHFRK